MVHGRMLPVAPIELAQLLLGASQADPQRSDISTRELSRDTTVGTNAVW